MQLTANPEYREANAEHLKAYKKEYDASNSDRIKENLAKKADFRSVAEHDAAKDGRDIEVKQRLERVKHAPPKQVATSSSKRKMQQSLQSKAIDG